VIRAWGDATAETCGLAARVGEQIDRNEATTWRQRSTDDVAAPGDYHTHWSSSSRSASLSRTGHSGEV